MGASILSQPRAGEIGTPSRRWLIIPAVSPVPPPIRREEPSPAPAPQYEPAAVPA
jgi:hypothetical protein